MRRSLRVDDSELFAEATSLIIAIPIRLTLIAVGALIANRLLRRGVNELTRRLGTVTAQQGEAVVSERSVERESRCPTVRSMSG